MSCATHNCSILKGNSSQNLFLYRYIIEGVSKANHTKQTMVFRSLKNSPLAPCRGRKENVKILPLTEINDFSRHFGIEFFGSQAVSFQLVMFGRKFNMVTRIICGFIKLNNTSPMATAKLYKSREF